jgi:predicted ATPase
LIERRKSLHERAGQALKSIFAGHSDDHLSELAHHYRHGDNASKAVEYLGRAGKQAMQRSAHVDAIGSLNAAIDLTSKLPDCPERNQRELSLQLALVPALIPVKGWVAPELEQAITRARELCELLGEPPELFQAVWGLANLHLLRGELRTAQKLTEQLVRLAVSTGDATQMLYAQYALAPPLFQMGEFAQARKHFEAAFSRYNRERHHSLTFRYYGIDVGVAGLSYSAPALWLLGYPDQALKRVDQALALADSLSHPFSLNFAGQFVCAVRQLRREERATQETAERLITHATEYGFSLANGNILHGWSIAKQSPEDGLAQIRKGLHELGYVLSLPRYLSLMADACLGTARLDDGLDALTEALAIADENEDRYYDPESYRLRGALLLKQNDSNVAEAQICFERAIEVARRQSAKSWELRATSSLARLLASQGRRNEAGSMLADIYNWFTEGFDTADLKDAKALLDELSG